MLIRASSERSNAARVAGSVWRSSVLPSSRQPDDFGARAVVGGGVVWGPVWPVPGVRGWWCVETFDLPDESFDLAVEMSSGDHGCRVEVEAEQSCLSLLDVQQHSRGLTPGLGSPPVIGGNPDQSDAESVEPLHGEPGPGLVGGVVHHIGQRTQGSLAASERLV